MPRAKITADLRPETRYARSGDTQIAYQVIGEGPVDLVYVPGWVTHLEYGWEEPSLARFYRRLASFSRLILFDKRGTGLSDQTTDLPTLEQRMDDVRAVMEAVGSERAVVFGMSEGGNMALLFAATYPERTIALVTFGVFASRVWSPDYPWAPTPDERQKFYDAIEHEWGGPIGVEDLAPSRAHDEHFRMWWASYQRRSASPRAALALARMNTLIDVRHVLPAIRVPTLVLHRTGDLDSNIEEGRYIAAHIPEARFVELPGNDHLLFVGDQDAVLHEVAGFIQGIRQAQDSASVLATVLCAEIVVPGIVTAGEESGRQQDLLKRFHALARREVEWFKGQAHGAWAEGFLATFDGPVRAIRCACAIRESARRLDVEIKVGLHTGLCDLKGAAVGGTAVEISRLVASEAAAGEVFVSSTVRDLVSGSGLAFRDRGMLTFEEHGEWHLFSVT
ncbi:MAG: adenylate/guanylate cyclase domain-containing protein [Acidobacteria bacterium]|nr:MAG: adenylate/guanylate cyclase domain-containing protein [Acidobacteriota bacterium]